MKKFLDLVDDAFLFDDLLWHYYDNSSMFKCLVDTKGYFVHVNKTWLRHTGWSFEEITSSPFMSFVHPEDVQRTLEAYKKQGQGQLPLQEEFTNRYRCKDGSYIKLTWLIDDMQHKGLSMAMAKLCEK